MATSIDPSLTTPEALRKWITSLHSAEIGTASRDAKAIVDKFFTDDAELTYANYPTVKGKEIITGFFHMQFSALDGFSHDVPEFDFISPDKLYQPADVGYLLRGDDINKPEDWIAVKALGIYRLKEEGGHLKIDKAQMFLDPSQVTERMKAKGLMP